MTSSQLNKFFNEVIQRLDASKTFGFDLLTFWSNTKEQKPQLKATEKATAKSHS
jgi:hypothetical protein